MDFHDGASTGYREAISFKKNSAFPSDGNAEFVLWMGGFLRVSCGGHSILRVPSVVLI